MILNKTYKEDIQLFDNIYNLSKKEINNFFLNLSFFLNADANIENLHTKIKDLFLYNEYNIEEEKTRKKLIYSNFWYDIETYYQIINILNEFHNIPNTKVFNKNLDDIMTDKKILPDKIGKRYISQISFLPLLKKIMILKSSYYESVQSKNWKITKDIFEDIKSYIIENDIFDDDKRILLFKKGFKCL